jgi:hypothetical protein
VKPEEVE